MVSGAHSPSMPEHPVAVVTGGARGMGAAIVGRLARDGATVVAADVGDASEVVAGLPEWEGRKSRSAELDITDSAAVDALAAATVEEFGRLDVMVNNAGIYTVGEVHELSDRDFQRVIEVNFYGVFYGCRAAARQMREQGYGRIVNTSSQLGKIARAGEAAYSASKAAVISLTQAVALELAPFGVTVNAICPGAVLTPMLKEEFGKAIGAARGISAEEAIEEYVRDEIPLGRIGEPEDMAAMVAWLASDEASFTTGSALNLTGGERVFF